MALVCAHYARLLAGLWLEMPMEHICIVKWARHRIVWPNQGFVRKAVMCLLLLQEQGGTRDTNYTIWIKLYINVLSSLKPGEVWES